MGSTRQRGGHATGDAGFTLIELVVVMVIAGAVLSFGVMSFAAWQAGTEQRGTADRLQSELRRASVLAVTEGRAHCVEVQTASQRVQTWRYRCATTGSPAGATRGGVVKPQGSNLTFTALNPLPTVTTARPCPTGSTCVYFYPRGTATPASFRVGSTKRSQTYTINVEGLTARVYR